MDVVRALKELRIVKGLGAGALIAGVVLAGCAPEADPTSKPAPAPEGFVAFMGDGYSFVYPEEWAVVAPEDRFFEQADVEIHGPDDEGKLPPVLVAISDPEWRGTLEDYIGQLKAVGDFTVTGYEEISEEAVEVSGGGAKLLVSEFPERVTADESVRSRQLDLLALSEDGLVVDLRIGLDAPMADEYEETLTTIVDSFRFD